MAGVYPPNLHVPHVPPEGNRAVGGVDGIVTAPDGQHGHDGLGQVPLKGRVELDVGAVVVEQVQLHLLDAGPVEQGLVQIAGLERHPPRQRGAALRVPPPGGRVLDQAAQGVAGGRAVRRRGLGPVGLEGSPKGPREPFAVEVAVLGDEGGERVGPAQGEAQADGGAEVADVEGEAAQVQGVHKGLEGGGQVLKGVVVAASRVDVGEAEAGQVGSKDSVAGEGEVGYQVAKHKGRAGEAVQQHNGGCRGRFGPGVAEKDRDAVCRHGGLVYRW